MQAFWNFIRDLLEAIFVRPAYDNGPLTHPMNQPDPDVLGPWTTFTGNRHNVRVLCDLAGLTLYDKNVITACVQQESQFNPDAVGKVNINGTRDWGLCQFNDGKNAKGQAYWIGKGAVFPDTDYVLEHPEECVKEMIRQYKAGNIKLWSSYKTGAYLKYMPK